MVSFEHYSAINKLEQDSLKPSQNWKCLTLCHVSLFLQETAQKTLEEQHWLMLVQSKCNIAGMTSYFMKHPRTAKEKSDLSVIFLFVRVHCRDSFLWLHSIFALAYFIITLLCMAHHSVRLDYREDEKVCQQHIKLFNHSVNHLICSVYHSKNLKK